MHATIPPPGTFSLAAEIPAETGWRQDLARLRQHLDLRVLIIFLAAASILTLQRYFAQYTLISGWLEGHVPKPHLEMTGSLIWCGAIVFLYLGVPALCIKGVFRQTLAAYGWSAGELRHHWRPYAVAFAAVVVPLVIAAGTPAFQAMYPFFNYVESGWALFVIWQLAYGLQFVSVEFFFRGFLLFGLFPRLGAYSILVAMVPYCMIHFAKPLGEALGAMAASILLGYLALKNRSIWGGAALHWAVALTMDLVAILLKHYPH